VRQTFAHDFRGNTPLGRAGFYLFAQSVPKKTTCRFDANLNGIAVKRLMVTRLKERKPQGEDFAQRFRGNHG
jgi:hypothetical protein